MRLATFNVENVFRRTRVLNLETWNDGRQILEAHAELSDLLRREIYGAEEKARIRDLLGQLGLDKGRRSRFVELVEQQGQLAATSSLRGLRVVAKGRGDWSGWLEFETEALNPRSTLNLAQALRDAHADILAVQEVENRLALVRLSRDIVSSVGGQAYAQALHMSGNDDRGLGLGVLTSPGHAIGWMRSHADDRDDEGRPIFDRDCPEIAVWTPSGATVWVVVAHLRSKGYGAAAAADARRRQQAAATASAYARLRKEGAEFVAVLGDLGDIPSSTALSPLVNDTDLKDISAHPAFVTDGHVGTFGRATAKEKLDYILLSPELFRRVTAGGTLRKGAWGPTKLPAWDVYPELRSSYDAASDHALLWCDIEA